MGEIKMDRMKTFFKYVIWLVLFFVLSEFLINVGLNSSYKDMQRLDDTKEVEIVEAKSTLVNGKIKGTVPAYIKKAEDENFLPVTVMARTFEGCTSLTTAPEIPSSVTAMFQTFEGCTSLTTALAIPSSVTDMWGTFRRLHKSNHSTSNSKLSYRYEGNI